MSTRDIKTVNSVADAYRSMYAKPIQIDEDILNQELIDALIEEVREEELNEVSLSTNMLQKDFANVWASKDSKLYRVLDTWVRMHGFVDNAKAYKKNPKAFIDSLKKVASNPEKYKKEYGNNFPQYINKPNKNQSFSESVELTEAMSKQMTVQQYANKIGIDAKEKQWILDNEPDMVAYFPNDKLKGAWNALSYPVRTGDYYFAFLTGDDDKRKKAASDANMKMNDLLKSELAKAKKLKFDGEPYNDDMIASHLWTKVYAAFEKLPRNLGAGDTMTREELYRAIYDITSGGEVQFESYDHEGETIQEGMVSGMLGKILNKVRNARKKIGKKIKLGRKAVIKASVAGAVYRGAVSAGSSNESVKYDANILKSVADTYASMQKYGIQGDVVEDIQESLSLLEKAYDQNDVKKVQGLEKKLRNMLKEVDKVMRGSGLSAPAFSNVRSGISKGLTSIEKFYKIANKNVKESINEVTDKEINMEYTPEETQLDEVQKVEVDSMKKVSKQMQAVLKAYQGVINKGDKELKDTKHNPTYKKVLDARNAVITMIGTLNNKMRMEEENLDERVSGDDTPLSLMVHSKDLDVFKKLKVIASKAGVKLAKELKGIKVEGPLKSLIAFTELMQKEPSFKKEAMGFPHIEINEKVKDGKLDPLSKMGKSKLTGAEINQYYRDNPKQKVAARDKTVKKAIELALDLSGNMNYAMKEIEKLKRGLTKLPSIKLALRHANESKEFTGHHVVIESLSSTNMVKLKTYGSMLAKITKLPFDDKDPEKGIDKLMGQIWQQKHSPANWDKLHKMVGMLNKIGVKMPSLKGKYMGYDPVSKKSIFYKEGTDDIVNWYDKIDEIKEEIEDLVEKSEMNWADVRKLGQMTDRNDHNGSLMYLAKLVGNKKAGDALKGIMQTHKALGYALWID
jgi:hypothetical protein